MGFGQDEDAHGSQSRRAIASRRPRLSSSMRQDRTIVRRQRRSRRRSTARVRHETAANPTPPHRCPDERASLAEIAPFIDAEVMFMAEDRCLPAGEPSFHAGSSPSLHAGSRRVSPRPCWRIRLSVTASPGADHPSTPIDLIADLIDLIAGGGRRDAGAHRRTSRADRVDLTTTGYCAVGTARGVPSRSVLPREIERVDPEERGKRRAEGVAEAQPSPIRKTPAAQEERFGFALFAEPPGRGSFRQSAQRPTACS